MLVKVTERLMSSMILVTWLREFGPLAPGAGRSRGTLQSPTNCLHIYYFSA